MLNYLFVITIILVVLNYSKLKRLYKALTFFSEKNIVENFRSVRSLEWPYRTARHGVVAGFDQTQFTDLPDNFVFRNEKINTKEWLKSHYTTGLVVLKIDDITKAKLIFEEYYLGNTATTKVISWSLNKSFVSALIGIAIAEDKIKSVDDVITDYVPKLKNSGYDKVRIKDVLQMSSGVHFNENYDSSFSDINVMFYSLVLGRNIDDYVCSLESEFEPGAKFNYISVDTQVLAMVLKSVIGSKSLTTYFEEKLWRLNGCESDCDWLLDNNKNRMELAFGTLNAETRDYANFGWLYANKGLSPFDGRRIIDEYWIDKSVRCVEAHLLPEHEEKLGYGYQWWIPAGDRMDYMAIGVYGQFIYIDPKNKIVIAKNSADPNYNSYVNENGINISELEAVNLFRTISDHYV